MLEILPNWLCTTLEKIWGEKRKLLIRHSLLTQLSDKILIFKVEQAPFIFDKYSLQTLACQSQRGCPPVAKPTCISLLGRVIVTAEQKVREYCQQWLLLMVVFFITTISPMRLCGFSFTFGKFEKKVWKS